MSDYKTKSDMAHDIVTSAEQDHKIERLLADAHYSTKALILKLTDGRTPFFKTIEDAIRYVREVKPTSISSLFKPLNRSVRDTYKSLNSFHKI